METKYSEKDIQLLQQLLQKLNEKKITRHTHTNLIASVKF